MGKLVAQLIEYGKSMSVDIAPVIHGAIIQPLTASQRLPTITGPEDDNGVFYEWKGEKIDLVFGDEYPSNRELQATKAVSIQSDLGRRG